VLGSGVPGEDDHPCFITENKQSLMKNSIIVMMMMIMMMLSMVIVAVMVMIE
jgi:hypothetical protein